MNTEIDIVISTPEYLLIGEAKHQETFGANSRHILVHQLIRQYVMASILVSMTVDENIVKTHKEILSFVVCDFPTQTRRMAQVEFLQKQGWINFSNVFSWAEIRCMNALK